VDDEFYINVQYPTVL